MAESKADSAEGMRILALFGSIVAFGSERANLEALTALRDRGATILLAVSDSEYAQSVRDYAQARGFEIAPCPYFSLPRPFNRVNPWVEIPIGMVRATFRFLQVHRQFRPTHIHAGNQAFVLNFLPALAMVRTPLVYRCGDAPALHHPIWRLTWRFISHRAARLAAVSRFIADRMAAAGTAPERITVVYSRPPSRVSYGAPATGLEPQTVVFMGQINEAKGVKLLVDAFRTVAPAFPAARLVIAGRINEDWEGDAWAVALRDEVLADPDLAGRVEFPGFVEDVPALLARAAIHAAPTVTDEPMGNVVMEAKQAGRPSIIFRSGGFPEVVEHAVTGYVCETRNVEALAAALRFYMSDPDATRAQGEAARKSLSEMGIDAFDETWERIYLEAGA